MHMDFNFDYVLENERVLIRPLVLEDEEHLLSFSLNEPNIWKYSLVSAAGREGLKNYLQIAVDGRAQEKEYPFIVFDKQAREYAGSTRFYDIQLPFDALQLGYTWYGSKFQGSGLNKNCKFLLLEFVFEKLGAERLEFRADNDNTRSIAAMKSIGCKVDGILRSNMPRPPGLPGRRDSIVLSILTDEWFNDVKQKLETRL
jgi:RimJ/RimL family protein N-acetyltransferase